MEKYVCIHGHFYQPPRENPWLESVELQDSAAPYHDWNERITQECYAPNATARILDGQGKIEQITNNYSKMSFNFGPTLLAWMADKMPEVHRAIVEADRISRERFSGHGSALAQVYNHMILPLASAADKYTQVLWGIRDFEFRFGRRPEGMWLSETAADTDTLEVLAELGLQFTVLSPFQASRVRAEGKRNSKDVNGGQIDPTQPYVARLPSGRSIHVFFYDAPVSQAVAFERLLMSGERLAHRLMSAFSDGRDRDQLVHIATDGESYGHHHRHGEMALAYAMKLIEDQGWARLTNYGEYLERHPANHTAVIHEKSAWSCSHGVGRWMADCGCNSGGRGHWNQAWRTPLRNALDWLRDEIAPAYESRAREFLKDPWLARNEYINVILDRTSASRERYLTAHGVRALNEEEQVQVWKLLEMQRHAMLMYTSCGWFFDEVSGIETVQVVQYASRAIQLAREVLGKDYEAGFLDRFQHAKSNIPEHGDGRTIYAKFVRPAQIDGQQATAHYAISSVFQQYGEKIRIFSFTFEDERRELVAVGKTKLIIGRARVISEITLDGGVFTYAILYMGEHNLSGAVRAFQNEEEFEQMLKDIREAYDAADFPETIRRIDRNFGGASYSLKSLFKDEQRRILNEILESTREDMESRFRLIAERYTPLVKFLHSASAPLPTALDTVMDYVLQSDIRALVTRDPIDFNLLQMRFREAEARGGRLLNSEIGYVIETRMEQLMTEIVAQPTDVERVQSLERLAAMVMPLPFGLNLWRVQNTYWELLQSLEPSYRDRAASGDDAARSWLEHFQSLGDRLSFARKNRATEVAAALAA